MSDAAFEVLDITGIGPDRAAALSHADKQMRAYNHPDEPLREFNGARVGAAARDGKPLFFEVSVRYVWPVDGSPA